MVAGTCPIPSVETEPSEVPPQDEKPSAYARWATRTLFEFHERIKELEVENALLREEAAAAQRLGAELEEVRAQLRAAEEASASAGAEASKLGRKLKRLEREHEKLKVELEAAKRKGKRQAAPFSKGDPKPDPKKPGRKKGGKRGRRPKPKPEEVDEVVEAPLPDCCPDCGSAELEETDVHDQYVFEIPKIKPHITQFNVHVGCCKGCGTRVQGRHPRQHSDALGAAAVQIGPNALAFAAHLNKTIGASYGKISKFFRVAFSFDVERSTICRGVGRVAQRAEAFYDEIAQRVRRSSAVNGDETSWRVGGGRWWLWVFTSAVATAYKIMPSRGKDVIDEVIGLDFEGILGHDGWHSYDQCQEATHQQCLQHPIRRAVELIESAPGPAKSFPRNVKAILQKALALRDRWKAETISLHGFRSALGRLETEFDRELERRLSYEPNARFAEHLKAHRDEWFTFLYVDEEVEATNWPGEQGLRPAVINRKVSGGGNRTEAGARTQEILMSLFRTCEQREIEPIELLVETMRSPNPAEFAKNFCEAALSQSQPSQGP